MSEEVDLMDVALADRRMAARMLGSLGGKRNTPAQRAARERNREKALKAMADKRALRKFKATSSVNNIIHTASDC